MKSILFYLIGLFIGFAVGFLAGLKTESMAAIKAGVAQYVVNPQTGETQFVYLTKPEATK